MFTAVRADVLRPNPGDKDKWKAQGIILRQNIIPVSMRHALLDGVIDQRLGLCRPNGLHTERRTFGCTICL